MILPCRVAPDSSLVAVIQESVSLPSSELIVNTWLQYLNISLQLAVTARSADRPLKYRAAAKSARQSDMTLLGHRSNLYSLWWGGTAGGIMDTAGGSEYLRSGRG